MTGSCRRAETSGPRSHEAYIAGVERIVARANAFGFWAAPIVLAKRRPVAPAAVAPMISRVSTRRGTASESAIDGAPVVVESTKCVAGSSFEDGSRGSVLTDCAEALCYDLADPGARPEAPIAHVSPSSRGPGRGPFKAKTRVRIPLGTP